VLTDWDAGAERAAAVGDSGGDAGQDRDAAGERPQVLLVALRVDAAPEAVPLARRAIGSSLACASASERELAADLKLLAGELLTNAVLHGRPPVDLRVAAGGGLLRVEVADASPVPPQRAAFGGLDDKYTMTGRGLALVDALATRWGTDLGADGKVVWAELEIPEGATFASQDHAAPAGVDAAAEEHVGGEGPSAVGGTVAPDPSAGLAPTSPVREARYRVALGEVSTDLLLAAKAHVDNLIREFTLAMTGASTGETAAVPPWLVELIGRVATRFGEARQAIRVQALAAAAAGQRRTRLELTLPASAADAGEEYLAALDKADEYARQARLLTLESPAAYGAFRRWYVTAIVAQVRAAARGLPAPPQVSFEEYQSRRTPQPRQSVPPEGG
jgi:anti-sigma regulatory factor (Ser/Thr protein kinase)